MLNYLLSNVYELIARATLLSLAIFPSMNLYMGLIEQAGDFSDWAVRGILVILAFLTGKPFAKFAAVGAAGAFAYLFTDEAIMLGNKLIALI